MTARPPSGVLQKLAAKVGLNRAVSFTAIGHFVAAIGSPVTSWLILRYCSSVEQGYLYTFSSLLAMQTLFELGFGQCLTQFIAHEFAKLKLTQDQNIEGDDRARGRILQLGRYGARFYIISASLAFVGLGGGGWLFFDPVTTGNVPWHGAWALLCGTTALSILLIGATSILQGFNEVAWVAFARTVSNSLRPLVLALSLVLGGKLYSPGLASAVSLGVLAGMVGWRWRRLFRIMIMAAPQAQAEISWWREVWPYQWRLSVSWICGYLAFSIFNPLIFKICGAEAAGRFGFTWSLLQNIAVVATIWHAANGPRYCSQISLGQWGELDRFWRRNSLLAFGVCVTGCLALVALAVGLQLMGSPYAARMLSPTDTLWLMGATLINNVINSWAVFLRSHKREPFVVLSVYSGIAVSLAILLAAKYSTISGVAIANFLATGVSLLIAARIFFRDRYMFRPGAPLSA